MLTVNVPNPASTIADLHPLDTFYYDGDLWILSNAEDSTGHRSALNLTSGSIVSLPKKNTNVIVVETTLSSTSELARLEDLAEI